MALDLTVFANAIDRLREGLARYQSNRADDLLRDGLIHRFKLAYEQCHRTLNRTLRDTAATPGEIPFQDLIRAASAQGLLRSDLPAWRNFREIRALVKEAHHEDIAQKVVAAIPDFLTETDHLTARLRTLHP